MKKIVCRQDQEHDIHDTTIHKYAIDGKHILDSNFKNYILDSMFPTSLCIMGKLQFVVSWSHKISLQANNLFMLQFLPQKNKLSQNEICAELRS